MKRALSLLLALLLCLALVGAAWASGEPGDTEETGPAEAPAEETKAFIEEEEAPADAEEAAPAEDGGTEEYYEYTITDGEAEITGFTGSWLILDIPDELGGCPVTSIGSEAFAESANLARVTIPDSVTDIGERAFADCKGLGDVTIGSGVTSIGRYMFSGCTKLTSVTIPYSVTRICEGAFADTLLDVVYYGGMTADWKAITIESGSDRLAGATIHYTCGDYSYTIADDEAEITDYTGSGGDVDIPAVLDGCTVTGIGKGAFQSKMLTTVTIPDSVTDIAENAFISNYVLTEVKFPSGLKSIGGSAFNGCQRLEEITLPTGLESIGDFAFNGCRSLTSITLPNSVTSLGLDVFYGCYALQSATLSAGLTTIPRSTFEDCWALTSVTIPYGVTSIGLMAFFGCKSLTAIELPESLTAIGEQAFHSCTSLTVVELPASVTAIGRYAFVRCTALQDVYYGGTERQWNGIRIEGYNDPLTEAAIHYGETMPIPLDADGDGVVTIADAVVFLRMPVHDLRQAAEVLRRLIGS